MFKSNLVVAVKAEDKYLTDQGNKVYLPYGTEYSLFFRNKDKRKALIGPIYIDGKDVLNGNRMIVDSSETWLFEGFYESNEEQSHRFKFIEKTDKIVDHRGNGPEDGLISVEFKFEKPHMPYVHTYVSSPYGSLNYPPGVRNFSNTLYSTAIGSVSANVQASVDLGGITGKGNEVEQEYNSGHIGVTEDHDVLTFGLYGANSEGKVTQILTSKTKVECNLCGTKNSPTGKFCSECGNHL